MDRLVWRIEYRGVPVEVTEDGSVRGPDPAVVSIVKSRLLEPLTVFRHGTVQSRAGAPRAAIELRPGDSRYVVARVRTLCDGEGDFRIVDCAWEDP